MLKLGKMTDYAITVMAQLYVEAASRSAAFLAEKTGIPEPTVAKVLKSLTRAGLVQSERGAAGGYRLAHGQISVGEVIEAIDGPIAIVSCIEGAEEHCVAEKTCPVKGKWNPVNHAIKSTLYALKIADMVSDSTPRKLYQITGGQNHVSHT